MRLILTALMAFLIFGVVAAPVDAYAKKSVYKKVAAARPQYNPKYAAFVVDGDTGKILYQEDADKLRYPASLTKMMTLYLLFEALENKKVRLDTVMEVSAYAASRPATNMSFTAGDKITVRDAILALIIRSANDVAVVTAETLSGSETAFAQLMTKRARQLGMKNTTFKNASGLHNPQQVTTAKDMALLGIALKKHYPQYFPYFAKTEFTFNGRDYPGHNHVMKLYPGADGLKTGFVNASGFNLVTTATRRGINLVGVVLGGRTHQSRDSQMMRLLDDGFTKAAAFKSQSYIASAQQNNTPQARPMQVAAAPVEQAANENNIEDQNPTGEGDDNEDANNTPPTPASDLTQYETGNYVKSLSAPAAASKTQQKSGKVTAQPFPKPKAGAKKPPIKKKVKKKRKTNAK